MDEKVQLVECAKCGTYVDQNTADAFNRLNARGEMYCAKCYDEVKPDQSKKVIKKQRGRYET
jgi:NAD-dependent SIR2 family protein deacetylase